MASEQELEQRSQTLEALERMQEFDATTLPRKDDLGAQLSFEAAVGPATRLIELYKRLSPTALEDFPIQDLKVIQTQANNDYSFFSQIIEFDATVENAAQKRKQVISQIENAYQASFKVLHSFISYSLHRAADFQRLDREARATFQEIRDQAKTITLEMEGTKEEAENLLSEVRRISAEQGVTQQAIHFKESADGHDEKARQWRKATIYVSIGLGVYALATIFLHKLPWIAPESTYDTTQLAVSKVLVFGVISFMLYLCARNFLSHKHNSIVNRHRQNALMTYTALVEATGNTSNRDVVLNQAAACIFGPQPTGYSGQAESQAPSAHSIVELLGRPIAGGD